MNTGTYIFKKKLNTSGTLVHLSEIAIRFLVMTVKRTPLPADTPLKKGNKKTFQFSLKGLYDMIML